MVLPVRGPRRALWLPCPGVGGFVRAGGSLGGQWLRLLLALCLLAGLSVQAQTNVSVSYENGGDSCVLVVLYRCNGPWYTAAHPTGANLASGIASAVADAHGCTDAAYAVQNHDQSGTSGPDAGVPVYTDLGAAASATAYFNINGTGCVVTSSNNIQYCYSITVKNTDVVCHNYGIFLGPGMGPNGPGPSDQFEGYQTAVPPGGSFTSSVCTNNPNAGPMYAEQYPCAGEPIVQTNFVGVTITNGIAPSSPGSPSNPTGGAGGQSGGEQVGPFAGTNGPINFVTTNNQTSVIMQGDAAIVDAITKVGQVAHLDANDIKQDIINQGTNSSSGAGFSTNIINGTNVITVNVTNTTDFSNALMGVSAFVSNSVAGSYGNTFLSGLAVSNAASASSVAGGVLPGLTNGLMGGFSGLSDLSSSGVTESEPNLMVSAGGFTFDLTPSHTDSRWAGLFTLARQIIGWGLLATYAVRCLIDIYGVVKMMGTVTQLQFPKVDATFLGIGGNWGAALAPVFMGVFLAACAAMCAAASVALVHVLNFAGATGGGFISTLSSSPFSGATGAVSSGLAFCALVVPLDLVVGLPVGYGLWLLGRNAFLTIFVVICRILMV